MTKAQEFRASMRKLLELLSSKEEQLQYQRNVPIANVEAELVCMWFDDMYHPDTELFKSSFTPEEMQLLESFNNLYDQHVSILPDTLHEYHKSKEWNQIMAEANNVLTNIKW